MLIPGYIWGLGIGRGASLEGKFLLLVIGATVSTIHELFRKKGYQL